MSAIVRLTAIVFTLMLFFDARAQDSDSIAHYKEATEAGVKNIRVLIRPVLTPEELEVEKRIRVTVDTSNSGVNAFASKAPSGNLDILIKVTLPQILEWIAVAYVFDEDSHYSGCGDEYSDEMLGRVIENTKRVADGRGYLRPVDSPFRYGLIHAGSCHHLPMQFASSSQDLEFRKMMGASIAFIYLHELAHHVHRDYDLAGLPLSQVRVAEASADAWAISVGARTHWELAAALPIMVFLQKTGGESIESENKSDHPLGTRRFLDMLMQTRGILQQWRAGPDALANIDAAIEVCRDRLE